MPEELLALLGVRVVAGRGFSPEDSQSKTTELLISWETWQGRFGGAADAVGRLAGAGSNAYEVVGVLPRGFFIPASGSDGRIDAFYLTPSPRRGDDNRDWGIADPAIARLKPGVSIEQARAEVAVIAADLARRSAATGTRVVAPERVKVNSLQAGMFLLHRPYILMIAVAVGLVLLLASVNLTVLVIARLQARQRETAIRASLGASRSRLARVVGLECLIVCLTSAGVAVLVCRLTQEAIFAVVPPGLQAFTVPVFDVRLLGLTAGLTALGAVVAAAMPAWQLTRANVAAILARGDNLRRPSRLPAGSALLAIEAALGVLLVAGAVVTVRSFAGMVLKHPGFVADDLYVMSTSAGWQSRWPMSEPWRDDRAPFMLQLVRTLPGVRQVGVGTGVPTEGNAGTDEFWKARGRYGSEFGITAGYFEALGTQLRAGRSFSENETSSVADVAVLTEAGVRALWPGKPIAQVVGQTFTYLDGSIKIVVGVVADFNRVPGESPDPILFLPYGTHGLGVGTSNVYVPLRMHPGVRPDLAEINRRLQTAWGRGSGAGIDYVPDTLAPWLRQPRFQAVLFGALAAISLVVAAVGLFAVASFESARRRFEMGIRLALGATKGQVLNVVLRAAVRPVLVGVVAGVIATWWAAQFVQSFIFEVDARGAETLVFVSVVLVLTAIGAAWQPARRAARTDPAVVLKTT
jgi:putative ABC transport system permease protein